MLPKGSRVLLTWAEKEDDYAELSFVCAKANLTPLKQASIPLKGVAILLLSRMMITV